MARVYKVISELLLKMFDCWQHFDIMSSISFCSTFGFAFAIIIIIVHCHCPLLQACPEDERRSLLDVKGDLIGGLSSWQGYNCCQWDGVVCDYHAGHVIRLDLSFSHLRGEIHPSLFNLQHLQYLDLSYNDFNNPTIPAQLAKLKSLAFFSLSCAGFGGEIPMELGNMTALRHLDLSLCHNSELKSTRFAEWVKNLRSLEYLAMENVNLSMASKQWGNALTTLSNLRQIHLSRCKLSGSIPSPLNLTHLTHLDLGFNNLTGEIPFSIGRLASVRYLDLSHNQISGPIPDAIAELVALKELDLSHNQISGPIPDAIAELVALKKLDLSHNQINGTIPVTIPELKQSFTSNSLRGSFSLALFNNLTLLETLVLSQNHFTVNISSDWIPRFVHLQYLGLSSCNLEGYFPAFLSTQYFLVELDLSDNGIVGSIPTWLWDLPNIEALNLSSNKLNGHVPHLQSTSLKLVDLHSNGLKGSLPEFQFMDYLDLSDNEFNGSSSILATATVGEYLSLSRNNLSGLLPDSLFPNNSCPNVLDLSNNKFSGKIPPNLGRCSGLMVLSLAQNDFHGEIPEELGNLSALSTLNLGGNRLRGIIPSSIASCKDLHVFDICHNKFEGSIPVWIGVLTQLQILSFTYNNFTDNIPWQLFSLQNLQIVDLSHNYLTGIIPQNLTNLQAMVNQTHSNQIHLADIGGWAFVNSPIIHNLQFIDEVTLWMKGRATSYVKILKELKLIDLSGNNLSGNIPSKMGSLKGLISLNLSNNNLGGSIPETFGGMALLESLDLSANKLSGKIPQQLVNLTFLEVLNLSDNKLSGLIPQGKQFWTFEASSFAGNPNLHGPPLDNTTTVKAGRRESGNQQEMVNRKAEAEADLDEDEDELDLWWAVALGLSFGVGFGLVVGVLCFHVGWRIKYFAVLDGVVAYLFDG